MTKPLEAAAIAMCDSWGYCWEGDPEDDQVIAEDSRYPDCRPDKKSFREASQRAALAYLRALAKQGPSNAVLDAGLECDDWSPSQIWPAMLSAHIKEMEEGE